MKWLQFSVKGTLQTHAKISDCKQWKISKYPVEGKYVLWRKAGKGWEMVGEAQESFLDAEKLIQQQRGDRK